MQALWRHPARGHLLPIAALSLVSAVATVASPALQGMPLLLVLLSPRLPFLLLASNSTPLAFLFVVATARLCVTDAQYFMLGRRYGAAALGWMPGGMRVGRWWSRLPVCAPLLLVFVRPVGRHLAMAGATPLSAPTVGMADVGSTALYVLAVCGFGTAIWG